MGHRPMYCTNSDDDPCALTDGYMLVSFMLNLSNHFHLSLGSSWFSIPSIGWS